MSGPSGETGRGGAPPRRGGRRDGPVVTLDGPAGSGKSSTAKAVAKRLGYRHLDSGALYRALTWALLDQGVPELAWPHLSESELRALDVAVDPESDTFRVLVAGRPVERELRAADVTDNVSHLARLPAARACLLDVQRAAGARGKLVADGRDMGTVVFPDAEVKVFLVADLDERARRRLREEGRDEPTPEDIAAQSRAIAQRDRRDSEREVSPLRRADDAHEIDTTKLGFEEQVAAIVELVRGTTS